MWSQVFNYGQAERIVDVEVEASTGNIYVLVNTQPLNSTSLVVDYIILKYSPTGTLLQTKIRDLVDSSHPNERDEASDMVLDNSGNLYVLFSHAHGSCTTADTKIVIDKYNSSLITQWTYNSPSEYVQPKTICFNSNGKLFAAYKYNFIPRVGLFSTSTASLLTQASLPMPGLDGSESLKLTADNFGNIYGVAEYYVDWSPNPGGNFAPKVIKIDNSVNVMWSDTIAGDTTGMFASYPNDLITDAAGDLYVSYNTFGSVDKSANLIKITSNGSKTWRKTYGLTGFNTLGHDLEITSANEILFATGEENANSITSTILRKFNTSGNVLWTSQSYSLQTVTEPTGRIAVGSNGNIYASGDANSRVFTIAFNGFTTGEFGNAIDHNSNLLLYPNPSKDKVNLELSSDAELEVINSIGQVVYKDNLKAGYNSLDLSSLKEGIYYFSIKVENNNTVYKMIKKD